MRRKVTKDEFIKIKSEEVPKYFTSLGFVEQEPGAFTRPRQGFLHGFGLVEDRSVVQFCVPVGVTVPAIWPKADFIMQGRYPALEVSHRLGEFRNNMRGLDRWYSFYTADELKEAIKTMHADFVEQAEPWLQRFETLEDVAEEYYRYRIGPPCMGEERPPDPAAWATYGWLLQELGRDDARDWLARAYNEVRIPLFMKHGRPVPPGTRGAREMPLSPEAKRLEQLLRDSLAIPESDPIKPP